jgi:predicted ATPase
VDALLRATPSLQLIATSREALRVEGEQIYQVSALEVPVAADEDQQSIAEYSAVQLLEARLSRGQVPYSADPSSASMKANICRRLDGIPLAIELAAARVESTPSIS